MAPLVGELPFGRGNSRAITWGVHHLHPCNFALCVRSALGSADGSRSLRFTRWWGGLIGNDIVKCSILQCV